MDEVVAALIKREQNGSTGFGKGVAVPHAKHPQIKKMVGAVGLTVGGLDFASLDHQPVYIVFLLLSPENQPQQHLGAMNIVFSNLNEEDVPADLRQCKTAEAVLDLLEEADQGKWVRKGERGLLNAELSIKRSLGHSEFSIDHSALRSHANRLPPDPDQQFAGASRPTGHAVCGSCNAVFVARQ